MKDNIRMNEFTFGGEVIYVKELKGEFSHFLKIRGISQRVNASSVNIVELSCFIPTALKVKDIKSYEDITISGHIETFNKVRPTGKVDSKNVFIVDYVL